MQSLQRSRPLIEHRLPLSSVPKGMDSSEEKVKGHSPISDYRKVRKALANVKEVVSSPIPADYEEKGRKSVKGLG